MPGFAEFDEIASFSKEDLTVKVKISIHQNPIFYGKQEAVLIG